ncbi:hypothetical protein VNO78_15508 [Psophocarpus tetragonolobus]|uniref:Uncharacterized protein n=1 Tax=Psophocarpus tetragonolobus TaxID=3891 RepID=A0AAN9SK45_PSOTE
MEIWLISMNKLKHLIPPKQLESLSNHLGFINESLCFKINGLRCNIVSMEEFPRSEIMKIKCQGCLIGESDEKSIFNSMGKEEIISSSLEERLIWRTSGQKKMKRRRKGGSLQSPFIRDSLIDKGSNNGQESIRGNKEKVRGRGHSRSIKELSSTKEVSQSKQKKNQAEVCRLMNSICIESRVFWKQNEEVKANKLWEISKTFGVEVVHTNSEVCLQAMNRASGILSLWGLNFVAGDNFHESGCVGVKGFERLCKESCGVTTKKCSELRKKITGLDQKVMHEELAHDYIKEQER